VRSLHEAILVSAAESEHRQDWSEAARAFLAGVGSNGSDADMELGFQVNVQMLRSVRVRGTRRPEANKWDDVLTFKPKPPPERPPSPTSKHSWYRLGPAYEELVGCEAEGPALLGDLFAALPDEDATAARDDLRHVIYDKMDFISELCARRPPPPAAARRRPPPATRGHARADGALAAGRFEYYRADRADGRGGEALPAALHDGHDAQDEDWRAMTLEQVAPAAPTRGAGLG